MDSSSTATCECTQPIAASLAVLPGELPERHYVADWRDPATYPPLESTNFKRLAWEFLRRNPAYAAYAQWLRTLPLEFHTRQRAKPTDLVKYLCCDPTPSQPEATLREYLRECASREITPTVLTPIQFLRLTWGVAYPLLASERYIDRPMLPGQKKRRPLFLSAAITLRSHPRFISSSGKPLLATKTMRTHIHPHEVWIKIRLNESITPQLKRASNILNKRQLAYSRPENAHLRGESYKVITPDKTATRVGSKKMRLHGKTLLFSVRAFDAVNVRTIVDKHPQLRGVAGFPSGLMGEGLFAGESIDAIATAVSTLLRKELKDKLSPVETTIDKARVSEWIKRAESYIFQHEYLRIAAYKPSTPQELDQKKKWAGANLNKVDTASTSSDVKN